MLLSTSFPPDTAVDASEGGGDDEHAGGERPEAPERLSLSTLAWPLLLSLGVLALIGYFTFDPAAFRQTVERVNPWLLAAAVATVVLRVGFGGWRLIHFSGGRLDLPGAVRSQVAWDFFAYVTPSTIGGGPLAAVYISRTRGLPLGEATSIILFAILMDQICFALTIPALLICAAYVDVFPASLGTVGSGAMMLFFGGFMGWVLVFGYSTLFRPRLLARLVGRLFSLRWLRRFRKRALGVVGDLEKRARVLRSQPPSFYVRGFCITLVPWIARYLLAVFVIWSVYPEVDKWLVFLRSAALNLGSLALPTPGGAGGVEGLYALFLGTPLIPKALVAPTLLVWRLLSYYLFIAAGIFTALRHVQQSAHQHAPVRLESEK